MMHDNLRRAGWMICLWLIGSLGSASWAYTGIPCTLGLYGRLTADNSTVQGYYGSFNGAGTTFVNWYATQTVIRPTAITLSAASPAWSIDLSSEANFKKDLWGICGYATGYGDNDGFIEYTDEGLAPHVYVGYWGGQPGGMGYHFVAAAGQKFMGGTVTFHVMEVGSPRVGVFTSVPTPLNWWWGAMTDFRTTAYSVYYSPNAGSYVWKDVILNLPSNVTEFWIFLEQWYSVPEFGGCSGRWELYDMDVSAYFDTACATPVFNPVPGRYAASSLDVTLSCPSPATGATIRYTLDGSDPIDNSPLYTGAIQITGNKTIKAKAWAAGRTPSPVTAADYVLTTPDPGKRWIRANDFALSATYNLPGPTMDPAYAQVGFTAFPCWSIFPQMLQAAVGYKLAKHVFLNTVQLTQDVINQANTVSLPAEENAWNICDEPIITDLPGIGQVADWLKMNRPNGLMYLNVNNTDDYFLNQVMTIVKPDVLMYDTYCFWETSLSPAGEDIDRYFQHLGIFRNKARQYGVPYFSYIQAFANTAGDRTPSESEIRMQAFSHLAAGYQGFEYFCWYAPSQTITDAIILNSVPTAKFYSIQTANPQIRRLGQYLRCLTSTDYRFIPGPGHSAPGGIDTWTAGAGEDTHITAISVNASGDKKDGQIGFFTDDYGDRFFMLVNLYRGQNLTADQASLGFTLTFNSGVNQLYRISRTTGRQETVALTNHQLTLTLPGGTGDLFAYSGFTHLFPSGSVVINSGNASTGTSAVTLALSASGGTGPLQMRFTNDRISWSTWEPYATTKAWTLASGYGTRTVGAQFKDASGGASAICEDAIVVSSTFPSLSGTINLQGYSDNRACVGVQFELRPVGGGSSIRRFVRLTENGSFLIDNITAGHYDVVIKAYAHRGVTYLNQDITGPLNLYEITLAGGDNDGDNHVTSSDLAIVLANLGL